MAQGMRMGLGMLVGLEASSTLEQIIGTGCF